MVASKSKARKGSSGGPVPGSPVPGTPVPGTPVPGSPVRGSPVPGTPVPGTPVPGSPVRGSQTGRPVMALLDLLGRRWALRVLWELRDPSALTFRELQARCGEISSSVLNDRLRELREAEIVGVQEGGGYRLTPDGRDLLAVLAPVDAWARDWGRRLSPG